MTKQLTGTITREWIDAFVPGHERTSCSDENTCNRGQNNSGAVRCIRCLLLDYEGDAFENLPVDLFISVEQRPRYQKITTEVPIIAGRTPKIQVEWH